jgi:4-amino-4-deoxy-L-arabinose transferase-like glycosyltransferase
MHETNNEQSRCQNRTNPPCRQHPRLLLSAECYHLCTLQEKNLNRTGSQWPATLLALAACTFFFLAGLALIPRVGIENDEAIFGVAFYEPHGADYSYHFGYLRLPFMLLPYLGTLKSWIYEPLFHAFGMGLNVLRIPALLIGTASLWLFYRLLVRLAGGGAALLGCVLLAGDATYLLTTCMDWGPVALQHLLLVGGMLVMVKFWQENRERALAAGFFLFGLALWDKALAIWTLGGLGMAALVTIPRQVLDILTIRRLGIAVLALALGALPLIFYNIHSRGNTFRSTAVFDQSDLAGKSRVLLGTFYGSALFGWMQAEDWQTDHPHEPRGFWQRASAHLASALRHPRRSLLLYAFCAALLLTPLARGRDLRAILFAAVAMVVAWCQMLFTAAAGGSAHHTILLWPLPQVVVAVSFAAASRRLRRAGRLIVGAVMAVVMASGLVVINENYAQMVRNGGAIAWTDAIFPLADYLKAVRGHFVFCMDWGFLDTVRLLSKNEVPVRVGVVQLLKPALTEPDRRELLDMLLEPDSLFVGHVKRFEFYPGLTARLVQFAEAAGYHREMAAVISDSYGRPTFEVYRLVRNSTAP